MGEYNLDEYKQFLNLKKKFKKRADWIHQLYQRNGRALWNIRNIKYLDDKIDIITDDGGYDEEYGVTIKTIEIPVYIFFDEKQIIKNHLKWIIFKDNLGLRKENQKEFIDID